jgi:hypothetical protein
LCLTGKLKGELDHSGQFSVRPVARWPCPCGLRQQRMKNTSK